MPLHVGNADLSVVEGGQNIGDAGANVFSALDLDDFFAGGIITQQFRCGGGGDGGLNGGFGRVRSRGRRFSFCRGFGRLAFSSGRGRRFFGGRASFGRRDTPGAANGIPTVVFPAGYNDHGQPINIQLLGRAWDDAKLVGMAYAFEVLANAAGKGHVAATTAPPLAFKPGNSLHRREPVACQDDPICKPVWAGSKK